MTNLPLTLTISCLLFFSASVSAQPAEHTNLSDSLKVIQLQEELRENPNDIDALVDISTILTMKGDYTGMEEYALRLLKLADSLGNLKAGAYGAMYLGHIYSKGLREGTYRDVYSYYELALDKARQLNDYRAISSVYNGMGIYAADIEMDYHKAMSYFMEALDHAEKSPWQNSYPIVIYNIALTYYQRNDPAGLPYAEELYKMALERKDDFLIYMGAFVSSYMNYLLDNYEEALRYIQIALDDGIRYISTTEAYSHYGNIMAKLGRDAEALEYYRIAMDKIGQSNMDSDVMTYLSYGSFLVDKGDNTSAIPLLKKGAEISSRINNGVYQYKLNRKLSEAYANIGDFRTALDYYQQFQVESDSIFSVERERSINDLRIRYESERKEKELQQKELIIVRAQKRTQLLVMTIGLIVLVLITIYVLYRRKHRMYKQIVLRQQEFLRREKRMRDIQHKQPVPSNGEEPSGAPAQRLEDIYERMEYIMQNDHVYMQKDLTRDKLAGMLDTNRTYLSKALSEYAGQTFYNYINSYRVNEAVKILSDTTTEIPIKALADHLGYNSLSTFHSSFQNVIGISPSKYRKTVLNIGSVEDE